MIRRTLKLTLVSSCLFAVVALSVLAGRADSPPPTAADFVEVAPVGLGQPINSGSWSMQWWNGYLYVGTVRAFDCWIWGALALEFPDLPYPESCPPPEDIDTMALQAEIWRYEPAVQEWELIYQSPEIVPDPNDPEHFIARDIGFRDMALFREQDGTEALYVTSVFPHVVRPEDPPSPRLLRSVDGVTFEQVEQGDAGDPENLGATERPSFSRLTVHRGKLYIIDGTVRGDGIVWASATPEQGLDTFYKVTPEDLSVFEMASFNGQLYVGTNVDVISSTLEAQVDSSLPVDVTPSGGVDWAPAQAGESTSGGEGYAVYRMDTSGSPPYTLVPVVTDGAYLDPPSNGVISMVEYRGGLYVGTDIPPEIIRIDPDDSWTLIMGDPRVLPDGTTLAPTSGIGQSFGWEYNIHVWRMIEHNDMLFAGTLDFSSSLFAYPQIPPPIRAQFGFDLYVSEDGYGFTEITHDGFENEPQIGVRGLASTPAGLFVGSMAPAEGLRIWRWSAPRVEEMYLPIVNVQAR